MDSKVSEVVSVLGGSRAPASGSTGAVEVAQPPEFEVVIAGADYLLDHIG